MNTLFLIILTFFIPIFLLFTERRTSSASAKLPPGSLGLPFIGQSITLLRNMRANTAEKWIHQRIQKYGPVSKLSLFGKPTVFLYGQAANKYVFTADSSCISNSQTQSIRAILGDRCILELIGEDHKRVRGALMSFLKPESLKRYVGKMDEEVRLHIQNYWKGQNEVKVLLLMKTLTFNIICSLLFGIERGARRDALVDWFQAMILGMWSIPIDLPFTRYNRSLQASKKVQNIVQEWFQAMILGMWSIPIDLPFTRYNRSLQASKKVQNIVQELINEKRMELEQKGANDHQDLITCLLSIRNENNESEITDKEIVHNIMLVLTAGHDTSSVLLTFLMRLLANEPSIYAAVLQEQEEIAKSKSKGESLTWEDLAKMYTWRVAMETMRVHPPIFGGFRKAIKDIEYDGYLIPKGWQIFWVTSITHMDNSIFQEPEQFDPARFENSVPPYSYIPFGGGPRICPGYEFARLETRHSALSCHSIFVEHDC